MHKFRIWLKIIHSWIKVALNIIAIITVALMLWYGASFHIGEEGTKFHIGIYMNGINHAIE